MQKSRHSGAQSVIPSFAGPHVAVIMDGNGRWATAHGLKRTAGHEAGLRTAREIVEAGVREGVGTMTLYAFSSDNWKPDTRGHGADAAVPTRPARRSEAVPRE